MNKIILLLTGIILVSSSCHKQEKFLLTGAGATFPFPLYNRMFTEYYKETGIEVEYEAIGSGAGIRKLLDRRIDFGATDAFLTEEEIDDAGMDILHIPICLGAVVISYNLDIPDTLNLTPQVISMIFRGKISRWNDPVISLINPGIALPESEINVVVRSDASGTTEIFTNYLSKIDDEWAAETGSGKKVDWVAGLASKGNSGVAEKIISQKGSIGYLEKIYARQNEMTVAKISNRSGNYIYPDPSSISLAADIDLPDHTRIRLTDPDSPGGYPISSFSWLILYRDLGYTGNRIKAVNTAKMVWWMLHEGQKYTVELGYAPLPDQAVLKAENLLKQLTYNQDIILK